MLEKTLLLLHQGTLFLIINACSALSDSVTILSVGMLVFYMVDWSYFRNLLGSSLHPLHLVVFLKYLTGLRNLCEFPLFLHTDSVTHFIWDSFTRSTIFSWSTSSSLLLTISLCFFKSINLSFKQHNI